MTVIVWFRRDLRMADNLALSAAAAPGEPVIPLYLHDEATAPGAASRWWLHGSLEALARDLAILGAPLLLRRGNPAEAIPALAREVGAKTIFWNRCYEPADIARDKALKAEMSASGITVKSFGASLLAEPWEVKTAAGDPYKVFTPFWRTLSGMEVARPLPAPQALTPAPALPSEDLAAWNLRPTKPDWASGLRAAWTPGEKGAATRLAGFLDGPVAGYAEARDYPARDATSRLSPHLHWGEISPRQIWQAAKLHADAHPETALGVAAFLRELGWRDFAHHLLYHWPHMAERAWKPEFDRFPWTPDDALFRAWKRGRTGYPIVDAGMRELWQTGTMHNRVRMIVASFLVKDLMIDWREGARWFEDTLVDADLANNRGGWQWVAGSGADAAPFFRIFNPVSQGEKFDADGAYVRRFVPELAALDTRFIHKPWEAPPLALEKAGIVLGATYPLPIVDHAMARARALAAYGGIKGNSGSSDG